MSTELVIPKGFGAPSKLFAPPAAGPDDMSAGVSSGFGVISCRGKVWRTKHRGEETDMTMEQGGYQVPRYSIEVVIVKAAPNLSKNFYEKGYEEGSNAAPECWSSNGVTPDSAATKKQCETCAICPQNQWGSKISDNNSKGKACSDSKRLAVVPLGDIENDALGGPMLLRVPAASLGDMATFSTNMRKLGYPYNSIGVRIAFDMKEAYPKFVFSAIRPLTDAEAQQIILLQDDPRVDRILESALENQTVGSTAPAAGAAFEQGIPDGSVAPQVEAPKAAIKPAPVKAAPARAVTPKVTPKPVATQVQQPVQIDLVELIDESMVAEEASEDDGSYSDGLDDELDKLLGPARAA